MVPGNRCWKPFRREDVDKPGKMFSDCLGFRLPYIKHLSIRLLNSISKVGAALHSESDLALSQNVFWAPRIQVGFPCSSSCVAVSPAPGWMCSPWSSSPTPASCLSSAMARRFVSKCPRVGLMLSAAGCPNPGQIAYPFFSSILSFVNWDKNSCYLIGVCARRTFRTEPGTY